MAEVIHTKSALTQSRRRVTYSKTTDSDGVVSRDPELDAAKIGALTTRTNGTTGTLTMASGHGITDGDIIDIYWEDGAAYGLTVGTVAGLSVPFTTAGGTMGTGGEALPADETAITAMVCDEEQFAFDKDFLQSLIVGCEGTPMIARITQSDDTLIKAIIVSPGTRQYLWNTDDPAGAANPLGADPVKVYLTHGSSASAKRPICEAVVS